MSASETPLFAVAEVRREVVDPSHLGPKILHYSIPALQETGRPLLDRPSDILSAKFRVCAGDILISKLNPRKGLVVELPAELDYPAVASTEFVVFQPTRIHRRFLSYVLQTESTRRWLDSHVRSVTRSHQRIEPEVISHMRLNLPGQSDQRQIADFLDDQVARIDRLTGFRVQQRNLLNEATAAEMEGALCQASRCLRALSTLTDPQRPIQYGIVLPGPDFAGGVRIVKGGDIRSGRLRRSELSRTDPEIEARYPRSRLCVGDLVIAIRGSVGDIDVVPEGLAGSNLTQDTARIAPWRCDPVWLRWVLTTPSVQSEIRRRVTGAMVPGINIDALRRVAVPDVPIDVQRAAGAEAESLSNRTKEISARLDSSVALLAEYKRALITAAVSGEFDVSTASGRGAPG